MMIETTTAISPAKTNQRRCICYNRDELNILLAVQSPLTLHFVDFPAARRTTAHMVDVHTPRDVDHFYNQGPVLVTWEGPAHANVLHPLFDDCGSHSIQGR